MSDILASIRRELKYQQELLARYEDWLRHAPEGRINARRDGRGVKKLYHQFTDQATGQPRRVRIRPQESQLIEQLKLKAYVKKSIPSLKDSIGSTEKMLPALKIFDPSKILDDLNDSYDGHPLKLENVVGQDVNLNWENLVERQNKAFPENLRYQASGGMYRSKSEMIIATQLARFGIPFKYEAEVQLGPFRMYPDFAVLNPLDGEIVYWEHLGMLEKSDYQKAVERKICTYCIHGIRPGDNLILTCDGEGHPLSALKIERLVRSYFL